MVQKICIVLFLVLFSQRVHASVIINEIAWQGYGGDANNEWIELVNTGSSTVELDGWLLESVDGTPSINLTGISVPAGSFVLLERTDDGTVPNVPADLLYTGALANTGEHLRLKNAEGVTVDEANFASGWEYPQDMSNTLSRFGSSWGEGIATPRAENVAIEYTENETTDEEDDVNNEDENEASTTASDGKKPEPIMYKTRKVSIIANRHGFVDTPFEFTGHVRDFDGGDMRRGIFVWNMGDGTVFVQAKPDPFTHVYEYAGEYVVSLMFNRAHFGKELDELESEVMGELIVTIFDDPVVIESFDHERIVLKNQSSQQIDLGGWVIQNANHTFSIPRRTLIRPGKTVSLSNSRTGLWSGPVSLLTQTRQVSAVWNGVDMPDTALRQEYAEPADVVADISSEVTSVTQSPDNVESLVESETLAASPIQQVSSSMYVILFVCVVVFGSLSVWFVVRRTNTNQMIDGYTIVEE